MKSSCDNNVKYHELHSESKDIATAVAVGTFLGNSEHQKIDLYPMTTETSIAPQSVFPQSKSATNMPFFDGKTLVFCQSTGTVSTTIATTGAIWKRIRQNKGLAERMKQLPRSQKVTYRPWKLAYCDWDNKIIRPIVTGLPGNIPERAPVFYWKDDNVHLSFLSGGVTATGFHYRLYTCSGPDLSRLDAPKIVSHHPTFFGFVSPHHLCRGIGRTLVLTEKATGTTFTFETSFYRVAAVNFLADNPAKLLITGIINKEQNPHTVIYDLATGQTSDISVEGPIYKATLHGDSVIFAEKQNGDFEKRELHRGTHTLSPSVITISKGK